MKQLQFNNAYASLKRMNSLVLPITQAYAIYKLFKLVEEHYNFAQEQEMKYLETYGGEITTDGNIKFKNEETLKKFKEKDNELINNEVDITISPVIVKIRDLSDQKISPIDFSNLEGFVIFE